MTKEELQKIIDQFDEDVWADDFQIPPHRKAPNRKRSLNRDSLFSDSDVFHFVANDPAKHRIYTFV